MRLHPPPIARNIAVRSSLPVSAREATHGFTHKSCGLRAATAVKSSRPLKVRYALINCHMAIRSARAEKCHKRSHCRRKDREFGGELRPAFYLERAATLAK